MPDFREYVRQNLPPLGVSGEREMEIVEELALEFQESYERAIRAGLTPEEAWKEMRDHARPWRELGDELRSVLGERQGKAPEPTTNMLSGFCDDIARDLRYAARQLLKSPGFAVIAVLTLALGIGANTAIFSLMNAVLLRNLPVRQPRELVLFGDGRAVGNADFMPHGATTLFSYPFFREFRRKNEVFSDVAAIGSHLYGTHGRVADAGNLEKINVELVSGSYFHTLGVNPVLGRLLSDSDDRTPGKHPVAVASYSWWQRRLARDPSVVGKTVTIRSTAYVIVGLAPPEFFGVTVGQSPDLWIPLAMDKEISPDEEGVEQNMNQFLHVIARRKPGIGKKQAQANTNLLFRQILRGYVDPKRTQRQLDYIQHARIDLTPAATGRSALRFQFSSPLKILMVVVALVLLIACANVANLLLARAAARQREIAVRMSMGAQRSRLIRQLLVESGLLGLAGAALGIALAWGGSRLLLLMVSTGSDLVPIRVTPDAQALGFTLAVTILTVLLFGTAPAFYATGLELAPSLKESRGVISTRMRNRFSRCLVAGQVALSLVLLAGAGLFLRSLANLMNVDTGFDKQNVLYMGIDLGAAGYQLDARMESVMERVEERVGSLPGMHGASFAYFVFNGGASSTDAIHVPGRPESEEHPSVDLNVVGPEYLDVMKMPIVLGRGLSSRDNEASPKVAVINETMARVYFPGGSPLGRTFGFLDEAEWQNVEVVGVVKDAKYTHLQEKRMPAAFYPHAQHFGRLLDTFVARYTGDPKFLVPEIREAVREIDPNLPVSDVTTLARMVDDSVLDQRVVAQLSTFFGMLAAFLACIGIYGVMSYGVTRRTNEFGIRIALGAEPRHVVWVVLREVLWLVMTGVAIGLGLALASSRLVESLLFGLKSYDPLALALAALALIAVALFAGYLPARRATRIDPMTALRHE